MAFKLRGNIFNNNTGSPLLRSNKAGSPFLNSSKCNKYGVVNGKTVCIERLKEATRPKKSFSEDPKEREKQKQWIKDNPEKYKEMLAETKTQTSTRDIKSGETTTFDKDLYDQLLSHKKRGDIDGWKKYLSDRNIDMNGKPFKKFIKKAKITRNNEIVRKKREENKKKNLPTKAEWCAKYPQNCIKGEPKEEFKKKKKQKPKKKTITTTTTGKDSLGEWSEYK